MFAKNCSLMLFGKVRLLNRVQKPLNSFNLHSNQIKFLFSDQSKPHDNKNQSHLITYVPIRPLKKFLTPLYVQDDYLNKGRVMKRIPFWPYLTPFYAMIVNNFLTSWSLLNTSITAMLLVVGLGLRASPSHKREHKILKLECNQQMSKLYMTIHFSLLSQYISEVYPQNYKSPQDWNIFTKEQLEKTEYEPTQADKRTFSSEELEAKKQEFDQKLFKKIIKEKQLEMTLSRFELDAQKTIFKLSNNPLANIMDYEVINPPIDINISQMLNIPYKYLIVRTQFVNKRNNRPFHFYIDLEQNGDLKYQDYLVALGAHYKISLASQIK